MYDALVEKTHAKLKLFCHLDMYYVLFSSMLIISGAVILKAYRVSWIKTSTYDM